MQFDDFKSLCERRRSIRYFDQKPVSKEEVVRLLELARLAPSVENLQPWHFHIIMNKEMQKTFIDACCYGNFIEGASVFIIVTSNSSLVNKSPDVVWNPRELEYSCMAAMMHVILGATAMGLGSCWVSLHHGATFDVLKLKRHETVIGGLMLGHYKKGEEKNSNGRQREPLKEMYTIYE